MNPTLPDRSACVLRDLVDGWAAARPEAVFAVLPDGAEWSFAELRRQARSAARGLQQLGVTQGDHVAVWLPNGADCLRVWFAINYIGAVYVPLNIAYRGLLLDHALATAAARILVTLRDLAARLAPDSRARVATLVVLDDDAPDPGWHGAAALRTDGAVAPLSRPIEPWDTQSIIFTSGTTGPSKGVLSSYAHLYAMATALSARPDGVAYLDASDRFMVNLPLFHVGGTAPTYALLVRGGSIALVESFNTARFWAVVAQTRTTVVILLGAMAGFLLKQPVAADERETTLRHAIVIPLTEDGPRFHERFGCTVHTVFNMSEISCPLVSDDNPTVVGSCGVPRSGVTMRLVDANDLPVPVGRVGELVIRTALPWQLNHGYQANPEATAAAWRNGWFHTGDAFRIDAERNYFFVDRFKDAIRRRGENISSYEVEREVCSHPAIREAAATAVASEHGEEEILIAISLAPGAVLPPAELIDYLRPRMAHFMIPRYIRIMPAATASAIAVSNSS